MKTTTKAVLTITALTILACDSYKGTLSVKQALSLNGDKNAKIAVPVGNYNASVDAGSKVSLTINLTKDQKVVAKFKLPAKPNSFNDIDYKADQTGQPYDVKGWEDTNSHDSPIVNENESCSYTTYVTECHNETIPQTCQTVTECDPQDPNQCKQHQVCTGGGTQQVCKDVPVNHYGTQWVQYYTTDSYTSRQLTLLDPASGQAAAVFQNQTSSSNKHYLQQGPCVANGFANPNPW